MNELISIGILIDVMPTLVLQLQYRVDVGPSVRYHFLVFITAQRRMNRRQAPSHYLETRKRSTAALTQP